MTPALHNLDLREVNENIDSGTITLCGLTTEEPCSREGEVTPSWLQKLLQKGKKKETKTRRVSYGCQMTVLPFIPGTKTLNVVWLPADHKANFGPHAHKSK